MRDIYMDHSATTPMYQEVVDTMLPYFTNEYGNPSSVYSKGRSAKRAVEQAREQVAALIKATPREIYFTRVILPSEAEPLAL